MRVRRGKNLTGLVVAITGAGRGIGAAIAQTLGQAGASLALGDLDADAATTVASAVGGARPYRLDVTDTASFRDFIDAAEGDLGPVDVLVNNAGVMWVGEFAGEPEAAARRQIDVNLGGVIRGMKIVVPRLVGRGRGHIVNIASAASRVPAIGEATYSATKAAVLGYSTAVRLELRGTGVAVSVVMPSVVETELAMGTDHGLVPRLRPDQVAAAVARVIARPRPEVYVPASLSAFAWMLTLIPARARHSLHYYSVPNQLRSSTVDRRAGYERRSGLVD
jgi:NADP-dependent 3-hydroxy acid dehydrogenase YdfG